MENFVVSCVRFVCATPNHAVQTVRCRTGQYGPIAAKPVLAGCNIVLGKSWLHQLTVARNVVISLNRKSATPKHALRTVRWASGVNGRNVLLRVVMERNREIAKSSNLPSLVARDVVS